MLTFMNAFLIDFCYSFYDILTMLDCN